MYKQRLLFSFLATAVFAAAAAPALAGGPALSREDARQIAINNVISGSANETTLFAYLYLQEGADSVLAPGEFVISQDFDENVIFNVTTETYLVFIDEYPTQRWEHACQYVFIDANTGTFQVIQALSFPLVNDAVDLYATSQQRLESTDFFFGDPDQFLMEPGFLPLTTDSYDDGVIPSFNALAAGDTCGVIIRGPETARDSSALDSATATDARRMRRIMESQGVPSNAIVEFRPRNGKEMADSLKKLGMGKKKLWVYYTGHGWKGGPYISSGATKADRFPTWKAMACSLKNSGVENSCIVIDACHSGSAIPAFQEKNLSGLIATSSHPDSTSDYWYRFIRNPDSTITVTYAESHYTAALDSCFKNAAADSSNPANGVDLAEAHRWARKDSLAAGRKPPEIGLLIDWDLFLRTADLINPSLVDPAFYTPEGMGINPFNFEYYTIFQSLDFPNTPHLATVHPYDPFFFDSFLFCLYQDPLQILDIAGPPDPFLNNPYRLGQQFFYGSNNICQTQYNVPFPDLTSIHTLPGIPEMLGHRFRSSDRTGVRRGVPDPRPEQPAAADGDLHPDHLHDESEREPTDSHRHHLGRPEHSAQRAEPAALAHRPAVLDSLGGPSTGRSCPCTCSATILRKVRSCSTWEASPLQGLDLQLQAVVPQGIAAFSGAIEQNKPRRHGTDGSAGLPGPPGDIVAYMVNGDPTPGGFEMFSFDLVFNQPGGPVSVAEQPVLPRKLQLSQSWPNPAAGTANIAFSLPSASSKATLSLYDVRGRLVRTLVDGSLPAGEHSFAWNGRSDAGTAARAGVYFYRLEVQLSGKREVRTNRLVWIK